MPKPTRDNCFRLPLNKVILLSDGNVPKEVQVLKTGTFFDKRYGQFEITASMLQTIKQNYDTDVRRLELSFDYMHDSENVAAGWVKGLELRETGTQLWAQVEWTPAGTKKLADKEFRYVSADFAQNYIDNETLKEYGPCLLGAALTNRPVIKGMDPITLTEGEGKMDEKDKLIEQLQAKIKELEAKAKPADDAGGSDDEKEMASKKALAEKDQQMADMKKKLDEYAEKDKKADEDKKLSEKKAKFEKLLSDGKAVKAQEEAFMKGDMEKFFELSEKTHGENEGHGKETTGTKAAGAEDEVLKLAEKKLKDKDAKDIGSAISMVLSENADLKKRYQSAEDKKRGRLIGAESDEE
jgi:hypothetical protein